MYHALHIKLINLPHPYPFEPGSEIDIWGRIILFYLSEDQDVTIIDTQWDIGIFCEWIANNVNFLCGETLDSPDDEYILPDGSIAEMLGKMSEREFHEGEEDLELKWFDYLYDFDLHHNLWRSLEGSIIPNMIIGINRGIGEISKHSDTTKLCYQFNMRDFIQETIQEIIKFLLYWKKYCRMNCSNERADKILLQMEQLKKEFLGDL